MPRNGCKLVQPLWRTVCKALKKLNIELPYYPAIPLLGIYPEIRETVIRKDTCTPMFIAALFIITKTWMQPNSYARRMDKEDVVHIYSGILLSHKKNEIMPFAPTRMNLEIIMPSEVRQ